MEAQVRFNDGETRSFAPAKRMTVRGDFLIISGWLRTVAIVPHKEVRWARLSERPRVSRHDFKTGAVL